MPAPRLNHTKNTVIAIILPQNPLHAACKLFPAELKPLFSTQADGIISTKANIISAAKEIGLITVQRFFLIDSLSLKNVIKYIESGHADTYEVLPGGMNKIITKLARLSNVPLIAGGLISDKEDVIAALAAGATAISSTDQGIWKL